MRAARTIMTFAATGFVAVAAGYIIENGEKTAATIGASLQSPGMARAAVLPDVPALPRPPIEILQATPLPTTYGWAKAQPESLPLGALDRSRFDDNLDQSCAVTLKASPAQGGVVRLSLQSPCSYNEPVTIRHAGLSFTEQTNENGRMSVEIPALTQNARIDAVMQNGQTYTQQIAVPDALDFQRVALVWRGEAGLHIHAREFGAQLGGSGHIWAGSPGDPTLGPASAGGYLTTLGDRKLANGTRAEVYTFPAGASSETGVVRLSVQAEIRNTNCGSVVAAQTIQPDGFGDALASDLTLRLPDCEKIGEHLVLKNILRDLKIASR